MLQVHTKLQHVLVILPLCTGVWSQSLLQLRGLSELRLDLVSGPGQERGLQLSALTGLTTLHLGMCRTLDTVGDRLC
jgi:hypothetical protein